MTLYEATGQQLKNEKTLYFVMRFCVLILIMNTTMFNVVLPEIARQFSLSAALSSWIVAGYTITFAIGTVTYGRLSDRFPLRTLFTAGFFILGVGSVMGMAAGNYIFLMLARVIQAAGFACVMGLNVVATSRYIPVERRGAAMAKLSAAAALGYGLGPVVGGMITEYLGWHALFAVSLLVSLMIPFYRGGLPDESLKKENVDLAGLFFLCLGFIPMLLFVNLGNVLFLLGIVFLFIFWKHIHRIEHPFVSPELLKNNAYLYSVLLAALTYFINFGTLFAVPFLLFEVYEETVAQIGLIIFPAVVLSSFASKFLGNLLDKKGPIIVIFLGAFFLFLSSFLFSSFGDLSRAAIIFFFFISSLGYVCMTSGIPNFLSVVLGKNQLGSGMGVMQLGQYFGGALGISVAGKFLSMDTQQLGAINALWQHADAKFSNLFLLLSVVGVITGIAAFLLKKKVSRSSVTRIHSC